MWLIGKLGDGGCEGSVRKYAMGRNGEGDADDGRYGHLRRRVEVAGPRVRRRAGVARLESRARARALQRMPSNALRAEPILPLHRCRRRLVHGRPRWRRGLGRKLGPAVVRLVRGDAPREGGSHLRRAGRRVKRNHGERSRGKGGAPPAGCPRPARTSGRPFASKSSKRNRLSPILFYS